MKKLLIVIALATLTAFVSCKKPKENQGEAVFTASIEQLDVKRSLSPTDVKRSLSPTDLSWVVGDQVVISNSDFETAKFTLQSGEGTATGSFGTTTEFNTVGPFIAAYPSTAVIVEDKATFNLPGTLSVEGDGVFADGTNLMVAYSDDKNLPFKNLCGALGIRLKGVGAHVSDIRITSKKTSDKLWGGFEVNNCDAAQPTLVEVPDTKGSNVVTLHCDVNLMTMAKTLYVMLPPGTLADGFTLEVLDGNEVLVTKEVSSSEALIERNSVKCINEVLIDVDFDGKVKIPTGMSPSDIVVTNFSEDAIPDEGGDFFIGYSKMLVATNADNGKIIYLSLNSIDENIRGNKVSEDEYSLNAQETAIVLALRLMPFDMRHGDDEVLSKMKEIVYSLPVVHDLEQTIENTINEYGYLDEDAIAAAVWDVGSFISEELWSIENEKTTNETKHVESETLAKPEFNPTNHKKGIEMRIKDSESKYLNNPDRWSIKCDAYSSLFFPVRIAEGYYDPIHYHFTESPTSHSYTIPPISLSQYVKLAEKMALLTNPLWANWILLFKDMRDALTDDEYMFQQTHMAMGNMLFELPRSANAIGVLTPEDDQKAHVSAILYSVLDLLSAICPVPVPVDNLIEVYLTDGEFLDYCHNQSDGTEGLKNIMTAAYHKLPEVYKTLLGIDIPLDLVNSYLFINNVCNGLDAFLAGVLSGDFPTFALTVNAEYYDVSFPTVRTSVMYETQYSAAVSGSVEGGVSASIVERGFVFGDMANSESTVIQVGSGTGSFETVIENLESEHTYYVMAYAKLSSGELLYGNEQTFVMYDGLLSVYTFKPSVGNNSTTAGFSGIINGFSGWYNLPVVNHGFTYKSEHEEEYTVINLGEGEINFNFVAFVENLSPNTKYLVRAFCSVLDQGYAINLLGNEQEFFTGNHPTVTTHEVQKNDITNTTAVVKGSVDFPDPNVTVDYEHGFVYGTNSSDLTVDSGNEVAVYQGSLWLDYSCTLRGLLPGTRYYVRAYSYEEDDNVQYGDVVDFTTVNDDPQVGTLDPIDVTGSSAMFRGSVSVSGESSQTVVERGFCYSTYSNPGIGYSGTTKVIVGSGMGAFTYNVEDLVPKTKYYVKAYAITNLGHTIYGLVKGFKTLGPDGPEGSVRGLFSVGDDKQVWFSKGNLQYQASTNTWRFAQNQYDYVGGVSSYWGTYNGNVSGSLNNDISSTYSGWIDLFAWGASGYDHGAVWYQPWSTGGWEDYFAYGDPYASLDAQSGKADWGYNAISNGGNQEGLWRTLSKDEWYYLLSRRTTPSGIRFVGAIVANAIGMVILPDDWSASEYTLYNTNMSYYNDNVISASDWVTKLEPAGAVFLPYAGSRSGTSVGDVGSAGQYWSSTPRTIGTYTCFSLKLQKSGSTTEDYIFRSTGASVRLVQDN